MNVGEKIRDIRKSKNISQKELGEKLGVSQAMIAQYENGKRNPKKETLIKIAYALDVFIGKLDSSWGTDMSNPDEYQKFKTKLEEFEINLEKKIEQEESTLLNAYWQLDETERKAVIKNMWQNGPKGCIIINTTKDRSHPYNILQEKIENGEQLTSEEQAQLIAYSKDAFTSCANAVNKFGETITKHFLLLNEEGQEKANEQIEHAIAQIEMLTKIPEYQVENAMQQIAKSYQDGHIQIVKKEEPNSETKPQN